MYLSVSVSLMGWEGVNLLCRSFSFTVSEQASRSKSLKLQIELYLDSGTQFHHFLSF